MAILIRIIMLLLPIILVVFWVRWRIKKNSEEGLTDKDSKQLRVVLVSVLVGLLLAGVGLRLTDDSGSEDQVYIPAYMENGKLVPGHFVPASDPEAARRLKKQKKNNEDSSDQTEG